MATPPVLGAASQNSGGSASKTLYEQRLNICGQCPLLKRNKRLPNQCSVCHCFVAIKAALKGERCPSGNW